MTDPVTELTISPMMQQWHECKKEAKGALLLFRLGDFYEAFYEDAVILSKELDLTLTRRQETPMSGVPAHTVENYIDRLVAKGYLVAIAEQMEDAKNVKGLVKRKIVRMVSPGTLVASPLLKEKSNNFIVGLALINQVFGLSILDVSTGEFSLISCEEEKSLVDELSRILPKEMVVSEKTIKLYPDLIEECKKSFSLSVIPLAEHYFDLKHCQLLLCEHFKIHSLDSFGISGETSGILAAGALLAYVRDDLCIHVEHIHTLHKESTLSYMAIDKATQKHLELPSLLSFMDHTQTPMGGRLLKKFLNYPLLSVEKIQERQDAIEEFFKSSLLDELRKLLANIRDLERLMMRIETGYCSPKDLVALADSLEMLPQVALTLQHFSTPLLKDQCLAFADLSSIVILIRKAIVPNPPLKLSDGGVFARNFDPALDELKNIQEDGKGFIAEYQTKLKAESGIKTLKVGYTKAFGFYIEISKAAASHVPPTFFRRQTLVNAERFTTEELKEFEYKLLHAEERIKALEAILFEQLLQSIISQAKQIRKAAEAIAVLDVMASLAKLAFHENYTRPLVDEGDVYTLEKARHPIVEKTLGKHLFIPNDLLLDSEKNRMLILTGPNMAGKSTFIRQTALIAIMAQTGSFVPAEKAHLGVVDKVFSRIGASDDLSRGQSTFMVEMSETANILNNATRKSLVILDEIGRGTSTYDGVAIAWAVADFLLHHPQGAPKTLFATHYFELTALEEENSGAVNFNVAVHESVNGIVFLHKIVKGGTDKSYGIHVARLAGLPAAAIRKAESMLKKLEKQQKLSKPKKEENLDFFVLPPAQDPHKEEIFQEISTVNTERLTPLEALQTLFRWKQKLEKKP